MPRFRVMKRAITYLLIAVGMLLFIEQIPPPPTTQTHHQNQPDAMKSIDCDAIQFDPKPNFAISDFPQNKSAVVDYAPWSAVSPNTHKVHNENLFHQILSIPTDELFIDVGANIGQMTLAGLAAGKITYAFDPLEYDITKICTGVKESIARGYVLPSQLKKMHLFRSLVGNESKANVSISRPDDSFGKFEQASLFANTIGVARKPQTLVQEFVPMTTLDSIVSPDVAVGLVKIDVQGFEWPVVQGMRGLLERSTGYPRVIHYEEQGRVTVGAGFQLGTIQRFLESFGYDCTNLKNDVNCIRYR